MQTYQCHHCGKVHEGPPLSYSAEAPALWLSISEKERGRSCALSTDQCVIENKFFYILGNIEIPILNSAGVFIWSAWVSLSEENFKRASRLWEHPGRESEPPYFGWLSTQLLVYPDTMNLKTMLHTRPVGVRPYVELEPTDHPLAVEQRTGITLARVQQFAEMLLHS